MPGLHSHVFFSSTLLSSCRTMLQILTRVIALIEWPAAIWGKWAFKLSLLMKTPRIVRGLCYADRARDFKRSPCRSHDRRCHSGRYWLRRKMTSSHIAKITDNPSNGWVSVKNTDHARARPTRSWAANIKPSSGTQANTSSRLACNDDRQTGHAQGHAKPQCVRIASRRNHVDFCLVATSMMMLGL